VDGPPAPPSLSTSDLVGRERERARLETFLGDIPSGVRALIVRGEPGIGKTTLWRLGVDRAREAGYEVLRARPAEEERSLALGGLVDLLEGVEVDRVALGDDDPIVRGRAVLAALRRVGERGTALLAIDDLQWLDGSSARALRYAIRRLDAEPIGILATVRAGVPEPLRAAELLPPGHADALDLGPLPPDELGAVVRARVGPISRPLLRRLYAISDGNPLFAVELARSLAAEGDGLRSDAKPRLPDSLAGAFAVRLGTVPDELVPLLECVSAFGRASVRTLDDALPDVEVERLVEQAERLGLLVVTDDFYVRFSHPLLGSVVYERMRPLARRSLHTRLAAHTENPDLRARHLALSADEPDETLASLLDAAAERAGSRDAPDVAAEYAEHSLRLTPAGAEEARRRRALVQIGNLAAAGEMSRALDLADGLVDELPPGPGRAEALVERAQLEDDDLEAGEELLVRALADAGDDVLLRGRVLDQLGWLRGVFRGDLAAGIDCAREALAVAVDSGDHPFEMSAAAGLSNMETLAGRPRPDLMERAIELEQELGRPALWVGPRVLYAEQLLWAGELGPARDLLVAADAEAARTSNERWRPYGLYDLAAVESAAGNLDRADDLLRQALEAARDSEDAHVESWIFYRLALVATWLGRATEACAAAERRLDAATRRGERPGVARARSVLGLLALSQGDAPAAASELVAAAQLLEEMGFAHPGAIPAVPDAIEALSLSGDAEAAGVLVERLEAQAEAVGSNWTDAALARSRGIVLLGQGDADVAADVLGAAGATFERLGFAPDAARARLLEGRALLRAARRTAAADALADASSRFAAMGATLWQARAAEQLDRAAPGRADGELTPTEARIAELVAEGLKNREIAQTLFVSVATVEAHLTRTYRKLGIRSRSALARLAAEGKLPIAGRRRDV
jgi:DNA-binding CsgD family transcriptional regulator/tetratricopeptide (TPR) repeat protein